MILTYEYEKNEKIMTNAQRSLWAFVMLRGLCFLRSSFKFVCVWGHFLTSPKRTCRSKVGAPTLKTTSSMCPGPFSCLFCLHVAQVYMVSPWEIWRDVIWRANEDFRSSIFGLKDRIANGLGSTYNSMHKPSTRRKLDWDFLEFLGYSIRKSSFNLHL